MCGYGCGAAHTVVFMCTHGVASRVCWPDLMCSTRLVGDSSFMCAVPQYTDLTSHKKWGYGDKRVDLLSVTFGSGDVLPVT